MQKEYQEQIERYRKGELSSEEIDALWELALAEPEVLAYMETWASIEHLEKQAPTQMMTSAPITSISSYRYWFAAAVLLIATTLILQLFKFKPDLSPIALAKISLMELESANITRSTASSSSIDLLFVEAFDAMISGDTQKARERYVRILEQANTPLEKAKAHFNLGVIEYNSKNFAESLQQLNQADALEVSYLPLQEKIKWFKVHTLISLNLKLEARAQAAEVYSLDGSFRRAAFLLVRKLDQELGLVDYDESYQLNEDL